METLLELPALSFANERHDVADVVLVGLLTGEWPALEDLVERGLHLEATQAGHVDADELERALAEFRYDRRLIAAADLRRWLADRNLRLADLEAVLRRRLLRDHGAGALGPAGTAPLAGKVMRAEAICSGTLLRLAAELRAWHAGCDWIAHLADDGSADWRPTADSAEVLKLVAAALADASSGLPALGSAQLQARAERLIALHSGYVRFRAEAVTDDGLDARLAERRAEWTVVTGSELSFEHEGAAREARLVVVYDGAALAEVAEMLGSKLVRRELELGSAPADVGAELLIAQQGDLVGPWCEGGRWRVLELSGRSESDEAWAGRARARAREELLGELIERRCAGKAGILASL
jgi:hypothetical protein